MAKKAMTPGYVFFYILFSPDTYRILIGIIASFVLSPLIMTPEVVVTGQVILYAMVATIGYSISGLPGRKIAQMIKKLVLGNKMPRT